MKISNLWVFALFTAGLTLSPASWGACSKESIAGKFVGEIFTADNSDGKISEYALMVKFNGTGGLQIIRLTEWNLRDFRISVGGGSYGLDSNCVGVANLNIKRNGTIVERGRINFYVGGTASTPEIIGHYYNKDDESTGSVRMIKSNL